MARERAASRLALLSCVFAAGCGSVSGRLVPPVPLPPSGSFHGGAGSVDITPIPGFPMGGHGSTGKTARGVWTRLYARAIYLEDRNGNGVALVAADLWSIPAGLADRVADLLSERTATRHLSRDRLLIAATHTHHSPASYSTSAAYNAFASRVAGFDVHMFRFLADRIATAIEKAAAAKAPATLDFSTTRAPGLWRNRSFAAFRLDPESADIVAANADCPPVTPTREYPDPACGKGVDPVVRVLTVRDATGGLIAAAAFAGAHATAMGHGLEVYSADFFGVAARTAERSLASGGRAPVVAVFAGPEGDVSPAWRFQDRRDAVGLGSKLGEAIVAATSGGDRVDGDVSSSFAIVAVRNQVFADAQGRRRRTARFALAGAPVLGGAEDGRTDLAKDWREGIRATFPTEDHGFKLGALDLDGIPLPITEALVALHEIPDRVPIAIHRVGRLLLATLPGEFTVVAGRRVAAAVAAGAASAPENVVTVGLANEYLSYFATPEEYDAQHYEGAFTGWGPQSLPLLELRMRELAKGAIPAEPAARAYRYKVGGRHAFRLTEIAPYAPRPRDGLAGVLVDLDSGAPLRKLPRVLWDDAVPPRRWEAGEPVTPSASVERRDPSGAWSPLVVGGFVEDDRGLDFVTIVRESTGDGSRWMVLWLPPKGVPAEAVVRLRVRRLRGDDVCSRPFAPGDVFDGPDPAHAAGPCAS